MASWRKRIERGGGSDLRPHERLLGGIFLNPDGHTGSLMAKEVAGVVGAAVAARRRDHEIPPSGLAAVLPDSECWLGLTGSRLLVWRHSVLRGRPGGLITHLPASDLVGVDLTRRRATHAVDLRFADGSARRYEAPRLMNDPVAFASAVNDR
ncbi:MAG: hypothetical protein AAGG08_14965 [Actinomycetota bacterium]